VQRPFVPYRNRPKVFLDFETTGFIAGYHEITEIATKHDEYGWWTVRVRPRHMDRAQPQALMVSGYNDADWADAMTFEEAIEPLLIRLEDAIIVGHNVAGFDLPFLRGELAVRKLPDGRISRALIDTQVLALVHAVPRGLKRLNLEACCDFYGIPNEGAHNAYDDVLRTEQLYHKLVKGQQELF
jgi:exodeoxyribonuclease V alpha subunit